MSIAKLAGHSSDLPYLITQILITPGCDFTSDDRDPEDPQNTAETLAHFHDVAEKLVNVMKQCSDETLLEPWSLTYGGHPVFLGPRYMAYRTIGLNHLMHHRTQMGVYLRLLNAPVPDIDGSTADEPFPS